LPDDEVAVPELQKVISTGSLHRPCTKAEEEQQSESVDAFHVHKDAKLYFVGDEEII